MTGRELIKLLEKNEWVLDRIKNDNHIMINPKNAFSFYFSGQTQDLSQRQGKAGWTKRSILLYVCEYLDSQL